MSRIAIIGGGPKAVALASKIAAIHLCQAKADSPPLDIQIVVYEPNSIGGNWSGGNGYTDGRQRLCTDPLRDLGFPYQTTRLEVLVPGLASEMLKEFSWPAFLITGEQSESYADWITRELPRSRHQDFSSYLTWAFEKSLKICGNNIIMKQSAVQGIDFKALTRQWIINSDGGKESYDAVVVTGMSDPSTPLIKDSSKKWFFTGKSFWFQENLERLTSVIGSSEDTVSILIAGCGGTAAAILNWFSDFEGLDIRVIGRNNYLDSRPINYFADRFYHDEDAWEALPEKNKINFLSSLERGRVWSCIINDLVSQNNFEYLIGSISPHADFIEDEVNLPDTDFNGVFQLILTDCSETYEGHILIDARSFNSRWFEDLLSDEVNNELGDIKSVGRSIDLRDYINDDLSLRRREGHEESSNFHVPNLSGFTAPYATNLMALGLLSERILARYISKALQS